MDRQYPAVEREKEIGEGVLTYVLPLVRAIQNAPVRIVTMCLDTDRELVALDSTGQLWSFDVADGEWTRWGMPIPFLKPVEAK